jgi:radical SAM superfamily enzyme YgiQ (UPF0313 family)
MKEGNTCKAVLLNPPTAAPSSEILLNLAYLSAVLKKEGHEVLILDATAPHNILSEEEIERRIKEFQTDFIGVTLTITYIPNTYKYLEKLSKLKIPIIAGGPHANCLPEEILQHGVDIVSIGEGEDTILELAEYFLGKKDLKDIEGICYKDEKGKHHYTKPRALIKNLDRIPFPDYEQFPIENYSGSKDPNSNPVFWGIFSSRGCPYNCTFCSSHNVFGRTYRFRSPQNVFDEIEYLVKKFGAELFAFQDDEAFIKKDRIIEFCNLVKKSQYSLKFSARLRIDNLDEEMLNVMKESGFVRLAFGVESWNDETLKNVNKMYKVNQVQDGFKILTRVGFKAVHYNNMIGFPWETPEHLEENLKRISNLDKNLKVFSAAVTPIPYPKTKLYDDYHQQYSFTNWWIDPKRNSPLPSIKAFFMLFMSTITSLYVEDFFWNYSQDMMRAIEKFSFEISLNNLKQIFKYPMYKILHNLTKISYRIWKHAPELERIIFYPFVTIVKWLELDKKAMFIYQI